MKKRSKFSRILALVLTMSLIFQQAGITTLAEDDTSAAAVSVEETELTATESVEEAVASETAAAKEASQEETTAPETQAAQTETTAVQTEAVQTETAAAQTETVQTEMAATQTKAAQTDSAEEETSAAQTDVADPAAEAQTNTAEEATEVQTDVAEETTEVQTNAADNDLEDETDSEAVTEAETLAAAEGETEAVLEAATEAESETETEVETETETETETEAETELVAALEGSVVQTVESREIDGETRAVIRYTVRVTNTPEVIVTEADADNTNAADANAAETNTTDANTTDVNTESAEAGETGAETNAAESSASSADASDVVVKAVLPETGVLTLLADEETTDGLTQDANQTNVVYWEQQTIAADTYNEYVFFTLADAVETAEAIGVGVTNTDALQADFYINDTQIPAENITWENTDLLTIEEEEGPTELVAYSGTVKITVTAEPGVLAAGTTLKVTRVSASKVTDAIEELLDEEQELGDTVAFDIVLVSADGEEIQPDGLVTVSFSNISFAEDAEADDAELIVTHVTDDYATATLMDTVDAGSVAASSEAETTSETSDATAAAVAVADVAIETTHFSVYAVSLITTPGVLEITEAYTAQNSFSYTVTVDNGDGTTSEVTYTSVAFDFHIFSVYAEISNHTNGNIATNYLTGGGQGFGTNQNATDGVLEYNYIGVSATGVGNIASGVVVLGSTVNVEVVDNGTMVTIGGGSQQSDTVSQNVYQETENNGEASDAYIDIEAELENLKALSAALATESTTSGVDTSATGAITVSSGTSVNYLNLTIADLLALADSNNEITIYGIDSSTLIISVDMAGITDDQKTKLANLKTTIYGYSNGEVVVRSDCNLLWNFYQTNDDGSISTYTTTDETYTGIGSTSDWFMGTILAPGAYVQYGALNGSVIATATKSNSKESHNWLYTGLSASLTVTKSVVGSGSGTFYFALFEDAAGTTRVSSQRVRSVTLSAGESATITFSNLTVGETYYVFETDSSGVPVDSNFNENSITWYVSGSGDSVVISSTSSDNTATIVNSSTGDTGSLKIKKNVTVNGSSTTTTEADGTYTFTVTNTSTNVSQTVEITISNGQSGTVTVSGLEAGTYTVTETGKNGATLTSSSNTTITVTTGSTATIETAEFTNDKEVEYGDLMIRKRVTAGGEALTDANITIADGTYYFYIKDSAGNTVRDNLELVITNGVSATKLVEDLPVGIYYVYENTSSNPDYMALTSGNGVEIEVKANVTADASPVAEFTNDYEEDQLGSLTIEKAVTVNGEAATSDLYSYVDGDYTFILWDDSMNEIDTIVISISNGQSNTVTISNLKPGTYYVSEDTASMPVSGMELVNPLSNLIEVTVTADNSSGIPLAFFRNNITVTGSLQIEKSVLVNGEAVEEWSKNKADGTYTFEIYRESDTNFENVVETVTITIENGISNTATVSKLKPGNYVIVETTPTNGTAFFEATNGDGTAASGNQVTVTVSADSAATVQTAKFVNNIDVEGSLAITKTLAGNDPDADDEFEFTVTLPASAAGTYTATHTTTNSAGETVTVSGGITSVTFAAASGATTAAATVTLKGGETLTISGFSAGISYTVTEADYANDGYATTVGTTTTDTASGTVSETGSSVEFTNTKDTFGGFSVTKEVSGSGSDSEKSFTFIVTLSEALNVTFNNVVFTDGVGTFTLTGGNTKTFSGIPSNISFTVEEVEADTDGYVTTWTVDGVAVDTDNGDVPGGTVSDGTTVAVVCTNTREIGNLKISKTVEGNAASTDQKFEFTVTLKDADGNPVSGEYSAIFTPARTSTSVTFDANGQTTFRLKDGESVVIEGILAGYTYAVEETDDAGYTSEVTSGSAGGTITEATTSAVAYKNTLNTYGRLTVTKTVETNDADVDTDATYFTFTITLDDTSIDGDYTVTRYSSAADTQGTSETVTFTAGVATVSLKDGERITIDNLPNGLGYKVVETFDSTDSDAPQADDWDVIASTNSEGTIVGDDEQTVLFTNVREVGALEISKTVSGNAGDTTATFEFEITIIESDGVTPLTGTYDAVLVTDNGDTPIEITFDSNGTTTYELSHGQTLIIEDLPDKASYTVTELDANTNGYETSVAKTTTGTVSTTISTDVTVTGTIDQDETEKADFVNTKDTYGELTLSKTIDGNGTNSDQSFEFTITLSDATFTKTYTDLSIKDVTGADTGETQTVIFTAGVATVTLKGGQSITIDELPNGISYTVTEANYSSEGYITTVAVDGTEATDPTNTASGTVTGNGTGTVAFTNTKNVGELTLSKLLSGNDVDYTVDFDFTITLGDTTNSNTYTAVKRDAKGDVDTSVTSVTFTNGVAEVSLKGSETITISGLPSGVSYYVQEVKNSANSDYKESATGYQGTIGTGTTSEAVFTNTRNTYGRLTVKKTVAGNGGDDTKEFEFTVKLYESDGVTLLTDENGDLINASYGDMDFVDSVATFTLTHGEYKTANSLPNGTVYVVEEKDYTTDGYVTKSVVTGSTIDADTEDGTGTIYANCDITETFTNTREIGTLTITKKLTGNDRSTSSTDTFTFTIVLTDGNGDPVSGTYSEVEFDANGEGEITLVGGQSRTIEGLPAGTTWKVSESASADGYELEEVVSNGVTVTVVKNDTTYANGTISTTDSSTATFTNRKDTYGNLTITKTVAGNDGAETKKFTFTVSLNSTSADGTYDALLYTSADDTAGTAATVTFTDGEATTMSVNGGAEETIALAHGQRLTIVDLPTGVTYTVTETDYRQDGYVTTYTGNTDTIYADCDLTAAFTNTRNVGYLKISKTLAGNATDSTKEFEFTVTLKGSDGTDISNTYDAVFYDGETETAGTVTFTDGTISAINGEAATTLKLTGGEWVLIEKLPEGAIYTVIETNYRSEGYEPTPARVQTGTIHTGRTDVEAFTNTKNTYGDLTITKTVKGTDADTTKAFQFTITLDDDGMLNGTTFEDTYNAVLYTSADDTTGTAATVTFAKTTDTATGITTGVATTMTVNGGTKDIALADGQSLVIQNLPNGVNYTVTEADYSGIGYTVTSTGTTGTIVGVDTTSTTTTSAAGSETATAAFVNTYATAGDITLTAVKTLTGRTLASDQFTFTITEVDAAGTAVANGFTGSAANNAAGAISFPTISYTQSGTYYYQITEVNDGQSGYTYDSSVYTVTVTVTDNGEGSLAAEVTGVSKDGSAIANGTAADVVFANTYAATGSLTLKATKSMVRTDSALGTFEFVLTDVTGVTSGTGTVLQTVTNDTTGAVTFAALEYTLDDAGKTYTYTVSEKTQIGTGYLFDETIYTVTVTAADNGDGTLKLTTMVTSGTEAEAAHTDAAIIFTNDVTSVKIKKVDVTTSEELAGATIQILDENGTVVEEWVSTEEAHEVTGLIPGKTYTLHETVAPDGYLVTADTTFVLKDDGTIDTAQTTTTISDNVLLVEDTKTSVKIRKVDVTTEEELPGATIRIVDENGTVVDEWTSTTEDHEVTGLIPGKTYTLRETVAPTGYDITTDTTFVLNTDGTIDTSKTTTTVKDGVLLVEDSMTVSATATISVTKNLTYQNEAIDAVDQTFYVGLYVDAACTNLYASKAIAFKNASSATVTFDGLEIGRTYYIAECDSTGAALASGVGTLADGTIFAADFGNGATTATATVTDGSQTTITFANEFYTMPGGFYKEGTLTITKKLLDPDGDAMSSSEVFYAGIFTDSSFTTLATNVSENIVKLDLAGSSSVSVEVGVSIGTGETVTLYVTEVDADGNPVADAADFAYEVSVDTTKVMLDETTTTAAVTITNQEIEEVEEESEYEEETETETETETTAVQTGDDTPLTQYLILLILALAIILMAVIYRRREREIKK